MPELPEVEHLRRSLDPWIVGARIATVRVVRRDVVELAPGERRKAEVFEKALGLGSTIIGTRRRGKQMAIELSSGRAFVVQLGMTGSVTIEVGAGPRGMEARHRHVRWEIEARHPFPNAARTEVAGDQAGRAVRPRREARREARREGGPDEREAGHAARLVFRDPRRFGGLVAYRSVTDLEKAWSALGPDALDIVPAVLVERLRGSQRPIKAALLDQSVLAGVGNIYADESLHAAGIHPLQPARSVDRAAGERLAGELHRILGAAVERGGSTLRDYRDAFGLPGSAVQTHKVYGRADEPCLACGAVLLGTSVQSRTTVFCPRCQPLRR